MLKGCLKGLAILIAASILAACGREGSESASVPYAGPVTPDCVVTDLCDEHTNACVVWINRDSNGCTVEILPHGSNPSWL